jgi:hypothetical protein
VTSFERKKPRNTETINKKEERIMKKYLCVLTISISLFLIAGPVSVQAQVHGSPWYSIIATVTECVGCGDAPLLDGVSVIYDSSSTKETIDGEYFTWSTEGCHTLKFEKPGYTTVTKSACVNTHKWQESLDVCLSEK